MKKVLFVLTSHDQLGNTGHKTGFWIEEFAAPYYALLDKGVHITIASPKGGQPPIDPKSDQPEASTPATERFKKDKVTQENNHQKPVAAVCHAPAIFKYTKNKKGHPLVEGKKVTGFSNEEEAAVQLTDVVPFLLEDMLRANGAEYSKVANWQPYAIEDGLLITGQNPASSELVAERLLEQLNN
jgi:putative intracellular protease/amidase